MTLIMIRTLKKTTTITVSSSQNLSEMWNYRICTLWNCEKADCHLTM